MKCPEAYGGKFEMNEDSQGISKVTFITGKCHASLGTLFNTAIGAAIRAVSHPSFPNER
jgi:hypothetical protein